MTINKNTAAIFILCLFYAIALTLIFDSDVLRDRLSYSGYYALDSTDMLIDAYHKSIIKFLTEEPLFLLLNIFLTKWLMIDKESLPYLYSFVICFTFSFLILKKAYNFLFLILAILMLLLVSVSMHAQLVVLRQSLATCILLYFVQKNKSIKFLILISILCSFIHNSFFIVTVYLLMIHFFNHKLNQYRDIILSVLISIFFSISFYLLAKYFSIRQLDYLDAEINASGSGFILWASCLFFILLRNFKEETISVNDMISVFGLIFYLINYFFLPIGGRLLITFIPFIFISLTSRPKNKNKYILYGLFLYNVMFIALNAYKLNENMSHNSFIDGHTLLHVLGL